MILCVLSIRMTVSGKLSGSMEIDITLSKEKYRVKPYSPGGKTSPRTNNSNGIKKPRKGTGLRPRKRTYGPF